MNERELIENLVQCVDELLPGIGIIAGIDIGNLNTTLIEARQYLLDNDEEK